MSTIHVVGAGLAGLAAAVRLSGAGRRVVVHESAGHGGGRCRSFFDDTLGCTIDNGNHLLLAGNRDAMAFLEIIGSRDSVHGPKDASFTFADLSDGKRWTIRPNAGRLPWWIFAAKRRAPGTSPGDYLAALKLALASRDATVADCLDTGRPAFERFWQPLVMAVLNADAREGAARLLWPVMVEIFGRGAAAAQPLIAREGLSRSFVEPAIAFITAHGGEVRFNERLHAVSHEADTIRSLDFTGGPVPLGTDDRVVFATPPLVAGELLGIDTPRGSRAIVNGHFRVDGPLPSDLPFLGLCGGTAHWLFIRGQVVSVTVSAADALAERPNEEVAATLWADVARALGLTGALPPWRVVKEKRATFAQLPSELPHRAPTRTRWRNLVLAGDWTDTGLPATIEGTIRSGFRAAAALLP